MESYERHQIADAIMFLNRRESLIIGTRTSVDIATPCQTSGKFQRTRELKTRKIVGRETIYVSFKKCL
jgi:hypothetical protein